MGRAGGAAGGAPATMRHRALGVLAIALSAEGRGPRAWPGWRSCPPPPPRCRGEDTDALAMRGIARFLAEDLPGAIADHSAAAARLRAGVPLRSPSQCLSHLALRRVAPRLLGRRVVHAELAVSLARDADRGEFSFVH